MTADGAVDLVVGPGPDPVAECRVADYKYDGFALTKDVESAAFPYGAFGTSVATADLAY